MSEPIDAEVMPPEGMAVARRPQSGLPTVADLEQQFSLAVRQRELLSDYIRQQLKPGKHFYEMQGSKPSLTKEGAEIILLPHNLATDYDLISGPDTPPADEMPYQITVKCTLRRKGDALSFVGSAIGSAGSHKRSRDGTYKPRQFDKYLCHNATLKMAEKSAMIAATMNSTAASEFFTQDLEPGEQQPTPGRSRGGQTQASRPAASPRPSPAPGRPTQKTVPLADENTRGKMLRQFEDLPLLGEFFAKIGWILPKSETAADLPLQFVPITQRQGDLLKNCFGNFENGGDAVAPYKANPHKVAPPTGNDAKGPEKPAVSSSSTSNEAAKMDKPVTTTKEGRPGPEQPGRIGDPEWWRDIICPIPPRGVPRAAYLKDPDTLGSMYEDRHDPDMARRLFGFIAHFEVKKTWTGNDGQERPNSPDQIKTDTRFREALDACKDYADKHGGDTEAPRTEAGKETQAAPQATEEYNPREEDDVPF